MLRARLERCGHFELEDVQVPTPGPDEVLLKVELAGICGSDMHAFHGKHPFVKPPIVLGHEFSGVIVQLGSRVDKDRHPLGQRVAVEPSIHCGTCYNCKIGRYNICDELNVVGCLSDGAYAEYIAIRSDKLVPLDESLSFEDGAMLEPLSVGVHALEQGRVRPGDRVLVLGAGTIGLLLAQAAEAVGAKAAVADMIDYRLNVARELGITRPINLVKERLEQALAEFAPDGADVIFECVGSAETIRQSIAVARKGIRIVILGVVDEDVLLPVSLIQDRELELVGDLMFTRKDFLTAQELIKSGKVNVRPLQTKIFPLAEVRDAFEYMMNHKQEALKVFLKP
jgi:L-iditol 2-dehydrogenase